MRKMYAIRNTFGGELNWSKKNKIEEKKCKITEIMG